MKTKFYYIFLIFFLFSLSGCYRSDQKKNFDFNYYFPISLKETIFYAQIAITPQELSSGLMFRKSLRDNHGMLFIFKNPQQVSFWMKNVSIPLDIGYFDASGILVEYYHLYPHDETPLFSRSKNIKYVLEMNKGWFKNNNIKTGNSINIDKIEKYIELRTKSSPK